MNPPRSIMFAVLGIAAWGLSQLIYRLSILPHLPEWRSVPMWLWGVQLLPLAAAVVATGVLSRTLREASINGLSLVVPPILVVAAYGALTGRPVGHDVWVGDPLYLIGVVAQMTVGVLGVVLTAAIARNVSTRGHGV